VVKDRLVQRALREAQTGEGGDVSQMAYA